MQSREEIEGLWEEDKFYRSFSDPQNMTVDLLGH